MIHGTGLPKDEIDIRMAHARNESHLAPSDGLFGRPVPFLGHFLVAAKGLRSVILCSYAISTLCTHMKHEASKLKTQTLFHGFKPGIRASTEIILKAFDHKPNVGPGAEQIWCFQQRTLLDVPSLAETHQYI